jgi:hypothetical protein
MEDDLCAATACCIGRFRDTAELNRLEAWIAAGSLPLAETAFAALALAAPGRAIGLLAETPIIDELSYNADRWLRRLCAFDRPAFQSVIGKRLRAGDLAAGGWYFWALTRDSDLVSELVTDCMARLNELLETESVNEEPKREIEHLIGMIASAITPRALLLIRDDAGFADSLSRYACRRVATSDYQPDQVLKNVHKILLRIGGEPFDRFLNSQLDRREYGWFPSKIRALQMAPSAANEARVRELFAESESTNSEEISAQRETCLETLAVFGDREVIVRAARANGIPHTRTLMTALAETPPLHDDDFRSLVDSFGKPDEKIRAIWGLAFSGREEARPLLLEEIRYGTSRETQDAAASALPYVSMRTATVEELLPLLEAREESVYLDSLFKIPGQQGIERAAQYLLSLRDDSVSETAARYAAWFVTGRDHVQSSLRLFGTGQSAPRISFGARRRSAGRQSDMSTARKWMNC